MLTLSRHDEQLWGEATDPVFSMNARVAAEPTGQNPPANPILFVTGGPRSGTTVMAQTLCHAFDVGYVDAAAARFWRAPLLGLEFSRQLFGGFPRPATFQSTYGRAAPQDIHSFHLFWLKHLCLRHARDLFDTERASQSSLERAVAYLGDMQAFIGKPLVVKGYYPSYFMDRLCGLSDQIVFVIINRDLGDQARSIYKARLDENRSLDAWWSMVPPAYSELLEMEWPSQIAGQCVGLRRMFKEAASSRGARAVSVEYDALCDRPAETCKWIAEEVETLTGSRLHPTGAVSAVARRAPAALPDADKDRLFGALAAAGWQESAPGT